jgi:heptosyltransferase-1
MHHPAVNLAGATSLIDLAALYDRMAMVISTDTGPMHIAAAVGTPVVALFGPTAEWRTGPYGDMHQVAAADLDCRPCF